MEVVRSQSANTGAEFYPHEISYGGATFGIYFEKFDNFDFLKGKIENAWKMQKIMLLLYEFSRGNQVDGSPRVAIPKQ